MGITVIQESPRHVAAVAVKNKYSVLPPSFPLGGGIKHLLKPGNAEIIVRPATLGYREVYRVSLWVDVVYSIGLHLISSCGEDHRRGKGSAVSTYTPYNGYPLPIGIVASFFKVLLLVEYLIK
jgi:hypothetical protein